jgi:hypothetical protein
MPIGRPWRIKCSTACENLTALARTMNVTSPNSNVGRLLISTVLPFLPICLTLKSGCASRCGSGDLREVSHVARSGSRLATGHSLVRGSPRGIGRRIPQSGSRHNRGHRTIPAPISTLRRNSLAARLSPRLGKTVSLRGCFLKFILPKCWSSRSVMAVSAPGIGVTAECGR